jgi:enoyl-CoA hydratase/carnithine racemase
MPGNMGTQNLPRAVGERRAKELILSAQPFTAAEAHAWGMVNKLCAPGTVVTEALATAEKIADCAPLSVRQAKKAIHIGLQTDLHSAYRYELEAYYPLLNTEDRKEGIAAFNEKRKAKFQGR